MQRLWLLQNGQFGSKIEKAKHLRNTILQERYSCSVQKTTRKNTKNWRNVTLLKIGHLAKTIAHAKAIALSRWPIFKIVSLLEYLVFFRVVFCTKQL